MANQPARRGASQGDDGDAFDYDASRSLLGGEEGTDARHTDSMFSNIAGVILQEDQDRFSRMLFRATRGNTFTNFQQIFEPMIDPKTGHNVQKLVTAKEALVKGEVEILTAVERGGNSHIEELRMFCVKEKSIYATLNLFEES